MRSLVEGVSLREQYINSSGESETPKDGFLVMSVRRRRRKQGTRDRENSRGYEDGKNQRRREAAAGQRERNSEE